MKRSYWLYGLFAGLLLILLRAIEYKTMVRDLELELFALLIAIVFLTVGVFVGVQIYQRVQRAHINKHLAGSLQLSQRELEVLVLLDEGLSNQEIADRLFVSLNTIKSHISKIYQKLNVTRRTQAIQKARQLDIIAPQKDDLFEITRKYEQISE